MSEKDCFNLDLVLENFEKSLVEKDDVNLEQYLASYEELNKFFSLLGTVFGFVSKDVREKMGVLAEHLKNDDVNFKTCKTMIKHEQESSLLNKKGYVSGSRTLLRLHRGLDFIRLFLKNLGEIENGVNVAPMCRLAYDETLAKYHSFLIAKGAKLAMYTMPNKGDLLKKVCGNEDANINHALDLLPRTLEVTALVYDRIQDLYTLNELHSLP